MGFFSNIFGKSKSESPAQNTIIIEFTIGESVPYKEVDGFFLYNNEVFYRHGNRSGKRVRDNVTFSEVIAEPDSTIAIKDVGSTIVQRLIAVNPDEVDG